MDTLRGGRCWLDAAQGLRRLLTRERLLLFGISLFSFVFRVGQLDTVFFGPEQAWIAHASWRLANLQEFPTHMFNANCGLQPIAVADLYHLHTLSFLE